eukprot:scaffold10860_cov182-Amphora_coffeaeformis.AAC.20
MRDVSEISIACDPTLNFFVPHASRTSINNNNNNLVGRRLLFFTIHHSMMRSRQTPRNELVPPFEINGGIRPSHWNHRSMFSRGGTGSYLVTFLIGAWMGSFSCSSSSMLAVKGGEGGVLHNHNSEGASKCMISFGTYQGPEYQSPDTVGTPYCLLENKFMKVQQHQVRQPASKEGEGESSIVIPDWLWLDYHDTVNVLVEAPGQPGHYSIFEQTKYGLEGRSSSAVVGGICELGETPSVTAQREVQEEMGLVCRTLHFLGRFRTDVNRGAGWNSSFLATDCAPKQQGGTTFDNSNQHSIGDLDMERQDLQIVSREDLRQRLRDGKFLEVKWSATVALALLHPAISSSEAASKVSQN